MQNQMQKSEVRVTTEILVLILEIVTVTPSDTFLL